MRPLVIFLFRNEQHQAHRQQTTFTWWWAPVLLPAAILKLQREERLCICWAMGPAETQPPCMLRRPGDVAGCLQPGPWARLEDTQRHPVVQDCGGQGEARSLLLPQAASSSLGRGRRLCFAQAAFLPFGQGAACGFTKLSKRNNQI